MDEFAEMAAREREARRIARRQWFWLHAAVYIPTQVILFVIWIAAGAQFPWLGDHPRRPRGLRLRDEDSRGDHDRSRATGRAAMKVLRGFAIAIRVRSRAVRRARGLYIDW
jgi:hypothetical protein